ncbi:peroxisome proliferator-activated receptor gamma coactivator 1-beta [Nematolebias whitei]|uniref:peroxisome proliferator-activated receptor gamma coactivator 1-beta n=1 Tax=Nematolebias whitei TaxID=451745 RepID=UPI001897DCF6|nr:peroxisome proliferator-activated receptor gamma coactivator 1-beta [Nematolebias whitei]
MADCAPLLDEELSSFVFSYLTENSCSQYGEEVCSDRLDTDFPDIDLSQLDTSDFDSVNCLNELQWCTDQPADVSPASIRYDTADELFEIEEENAALLAALTDSFDGIVDAEVGRLSVFPALGEEPSQEEDDEESLPLRVEDFSQSLGAETEDLSLLKKLLLTPPNVPTGIDVHKDGVHSHRYGNRSLRLRPARALTKPQSELPQERKPRAVRPAGRLCTELHRHLTTAQDTENSPGPEAGEDEEEEDDEDSESEEDDEEEGEEEESSSSEVEGAAGAAAVPTEPAMPQFSSEKELQSVVELITYMHTYCLPMRKQQAWERKDAPRPRVKPEASRSASTNSHSRVVLVAAPGTIGSLTGTGTSTPRRLPFTRRREMKANSLLRELLQQSSSFDVSKPYRLHNPPYTHSQSPTRGVAPAPSALMNKSAPAWPPSSSVLNPELSKDSALPERTNCSSEPSQSLDEPAETSGSFSVRRSRRLASFPSRFAKRLRPGRARDGAGNDKVATDERKAGDKLLPTQAGGGTTTETQPEKQRSSDGSTTSAPTDPCCHEKRACLCLPLNPKSTGESQYNTRPYEQTLSVDLCGTAGLTPPTTPPHKPVEDELFKPTEGGKGGGSTDGGGEVESVHPASNTNNNVATKASAWLSRSHHQRKLPEQTELYAQLRRMGHASNTQRNFGDHDYCMLSLGEGYKQNATVLGAFLRQQEGSEDDISQAPKAAADPVPEKKDKESKEERLVMAEVVETQEQQMTMMISVSPPSDCQSVAATPPASEEEAECSSASRSPSPILYMCPDSPSSKTDSSENSESCPDDNQRNKTNSDEDNCQVFYIHHLPNRVTENMLRKRFQVFGNTEDCKVIICNEERCGVIKIRQSGAQKHRRERESVFQNAPAGLRRLTRKRYIDLDEAGPGPVKSKYDALDFDTLLKEAQKSLHR